MNYTVEDAIVELEEFVRESTGKIKFNFNGKTLRDAERNTWLNSRKNGNTEIIIAHAILLLKQLVQRRKRGWIEFYCEDGVIYDYEDNQKR